MLWDSRNDVHRQWPCGARLVLRAEHAHGVCNQCRVTAHQRPRKRRRKPDFVDVPLPGFEDLR